MHPNPVYRNASCERNLEFAEKRGFAVLAVGGENAGQSPLLSHIPFILADGGGAVHAHLVRSNPIAQCLRAGERKAVLAINGPDAYVSPDWYAGMPDQVPSGPTWRCTCEERFAFAPRRRFVPISTRSPRDSRKHFARNHRGAQQRSRPSASPR